MARVKDAALIQKRTAQAQELLAALSEDYLTTPSEALLTQVRQYCAWLPLEAEEHKTLIATLRDALVERDVAGLLQLQPSVKMRTSECVELRRRLAVHYGFLIASVTGPRMKDRFEDDWSVLAGWACLTGTSLQIIREKQNTSTADDMVKMLGKSDFAVSVEVIEDHMRSAKASQPVNAAKSLRLKESDALVIAKLLNSGTSESSWKHYRTDGLRLLFDITGARQPRAVIVRRPGQTDIQRTGSVRS